MLLMSRGDDEAEATRQADKRRYRLVLTASKSRCFVAVN